jgi:hypothetical protein
MSVSVSVPAAVRPAMAPAPTAAARAGEESGEEGMELGHAILWDINGDRLVLRVGRGFPIHDLLLSFAYAS